jgi:8-oxo-dGTP pyrophosphatase MutT (NUDIX family)
VDLHPWQHQWRLPSGGIDPADPDAESAARRELAEETGLRAARWTRIGQVSGADSFTNHVDHVYLAENLTEGTATPGPGEADLEVSRLPFADALDLVLSGRMSHAGSAYAVLVAAAARAAG